MTGNGASGLSRVTIVAPRARIDLGLPSDVPLAHLLPTVLGLAGDELADDPEAVHGWSLARLDGAPLDIGGSLVQQAVRDGEVLYLRPRDDAAPAPVYDDMADAVAGATERLPGRWTATTTRVTGRWLAALALTAGAVVLFFAGLPSLAAGSAALGLAMILAVAGMLASRAYADSVLGAVLAGPAAAYAFAGGLRILGGDPGRLTAADLLLGATAALLFSVLGLFGVGSAEQGFVATGTAAAGLMAGAAIALAAGSAAAASIGAGLALLVLPAAPLAAARAARMQPATTLDDEPIPAGAVAMLVVHADAILTGLLIGLAGGAVVAAATLALVGTGPALALAAVAGLLLLSRARSLIRVPHRLPLLGGGLLALAAAGAGLFAHGGPAVRVGVLLPALAVLAVAGLVPAARRAARVSPFWGRVADLAEVVLALAVVPLIVWVSGAYDWARSLAGG